MKKVYASLRKVLTLLCFIIFGLGSLVITVTVLPPLWVFCWSREIRRIVFVYTIRLSWCFFRKVMESLWLIKIQVSQKDRQTLASAKSTIIVANHTSLIDIIILVSLTKDATCIARGELFQNPLIRFIMLNAFIANDGDSIELIGRSATALRGGYNLIIFPEGTRSTGGGKLRRGTAYIAAKSLSDILVLKINVDPQHLRKGKGWRDAAEKRVVYDISVKAVLKPLEMVDAKKSRNINARRITTRIEEAMGDH